MDQEPLSLHRIGIDQVRDLFDALIEGAGGELPEFGRQLLEGYSVVIPDPASTINSYTDADVLNAIVRSLLEEDLQDSLQQFLRKRISKKELFDLCSFFWGTLSVHVELFLRQPPIVGRPLIQETNGWFVVAQEGLPPYKFQESLSAARVWSLFSTLGKGWLLRYLEAYTANRKLAELFNELGLGQDILVEWIVQKSLRSLHRARLASYQRFWQKSTQEPARNAPAIPGPVGSKPASVISKSNWEFPDEYVRKLADWLSQNEPRPFILPDLFSEDELGNQFPVDLNNLCQVQGLALLVGLPGGGKTTLQRWVARNRPAQNPGIDIFVDLKRFVASGLSNLYEYAADVLIRDFTLEVDFPQLRLSLIDMERQGLVYWHIENWDRLGVEDRTRCVSNLMGLSRALISVEDLVEFTQTIRERSQHLPHDIIRILPWEAPKQLLFEDQFCYEKPDVHPEVILARTKQLPGLATLPSGIWYLCDHADQSLAEILIGYLSARQVALGNRPIHVSLEQVNRKWMVRWDNSMVNQVFEMVSALLQRGPVTVFEVERLRKMDAISLSSQLTVYGESLGVRRKRSVDLFQAGCQSGLLTHFSLFTYSFAVPEIGVLLASVAVWGSDSREIVLKEARNLAARRPVGPELEILLSFAKLYL